MLARLHKLHSEGYDPNATLDLAMSEGWRGIWPSEECRRKIRPASHSEGVKLEVVHVNKDVARDAVAAARRAVK